MLTTGYVLCAKYTFACDATSASIFSDVCSAGIYTTMVNQYVGYTTLAQLNNRLTVLAPMAAAQDMAFLKICNVPVTNCGSVSSYPPPLRAG